MFTVSTFLKNKWSYSGLGLTQNS